MTVDEAEIWRRRVCTSKVRLGRVTADALAERLRRRSPTYVAYRCPFATDGHHWHIGRHVISVQAMGLVALAMRVIALGRALETSPATADSGVTLESRS